METRTSSKVISHILVSLALVVVMAGCGLGAPENTPTPQPDRGTLAEGEAIAIVQTHLSSRNIGERTCLDIYSFLLETGPKNI